MAIELKVRLMLSLDKVLLVFSVQSEGKNVNLHPPPTNVNCLTKYGTNNRCQAWETDEHNQEKQQCRLFSSTDNVFHGI